MLLCQLTEIKITKTEIKINKAKKKWIKKKTYTKIKTQNIKKQ